MTKLVIEPLPSEQYAGTAPITTKTAVTARIHRHAGMLRVAFALEMVRRQAAGLSSTNVRGGVASRQQASPGTSAQMRSSAHGFFNPVDLG
jgi:hypothetical protein